MRETRGGIVSSTLPIREYSNDKVYRRERELCLAELKCMSKRF
jgi:hypothetical protein